MSEYGIAIKKLAEHYKGDLSMLGAFQNQDKNPFYILISTILSARNRDETTEVVAAELLEKYPTPQALAAADRKEVENILKKIGLWRQKVERVMETSRILVEEYGGEVPDDYEELMKLPGVGTKVAGCVLVYAFGRDYIPADTHVHRISNRLGWADTKTAPQTEKELMKKIPKRYWKHVNEVLVLHGKNTCKPNPLCSQCPITEHCNYYGTQ